MLVDTMLVDTRTPGSMMKELSGKSSLQISRRSLESSGTPTSIEGPSKGNSCDQGLSRTVSPLDPSEAHEVSLAMDLDLMQLQASTDAGLQEQQAQHQGEVQQDATARQVPHPVHTLVRDPYTCSWSRNGHAPAEHVFREQQPKRSTDSFVTQRSLGAVASLQHAFSTRSSTSEAGTYRTGKDSASESVQRSKQLRITVLPRQSPWQASISAKLSYTFGRTAKQPLRIEARLGLRVVPMVVNPLDAPDTETLEALAAGDRHNIEAGLQLDLEGCGAGLLTLDASAGSNVLASGIMLLLPPGRQAVAEELSRDTGGSVTDRLLSDLAAIIECEDVIRNAARSVRLTDEDVQRRMGDQNGRKRAAPEQDDILDPFRVSGLISTGRNLQNRAAALQWHATVQLLRQALDVLDCFVTLMLEEGSCIGSAAINAAAAAVSASEAVSSSMLLDVGDGGSTTRPNAELVAGQLSINAVAWCSIVLATACISALGVFYSIFHQYAWLHGDIK